MQLSPPASPLPANTAKINTLAKWSTFFHLSTGIFRGPDSRAEGIEHLDIDLRYIEHPPSLSRQAPKDVLPVNMLDVVVLTLRGGEFCQEVDERMECLKEVLDAISPKEVRWLNAFDHPDEQLTITTVMVHPAIIAAGEGWARNGRLSKLVIQGGFPTPNLTAPTPFAVTPAGTPLPSPGLKSHFGTVVSALPALSTIKPKPVDEHKLAERAERKRLADYALKPRWEFAFGTWAVEEIKWKFDGKYTPAAMVTIIKLLLTSLDESYPSPAHRCDLDLPSLLTFSPVSPKVIDNLHLLQTSLDLQQGMIDYLADVAYLSLDHARFFSLWGEESSDEDRYRQSRAFKTQALLLRDPRAEIIHREELSHEAAPPSPSTPESGALAVPALAHSPSTPGITDASTDDEGEGDALTPEMGHSMVLESAQPAEATRGKVAGLARTMEGSLII